VVLSKVYWKIKCYCTLFNLNVDFRSIGPNSTRLPIQWFVLSKMGAWFTYNFIFIAVWEQQSMNSHSFRTLVAVLPSQYSLEKADVMLVYFTVINKLFCAFKIPNIFHLKFRCC
jgi:hypothetical protein